MSTVSLAAFTIVQNEDIFSRIWVDYYSKFIPKKHLYVLNHNSSTPKSMQHLDDFKREGVNVLNVHRDLSFDHLWLRSTVESFQAYLLKSYRVVLFAESDEIITIHPEALNSDLDKYIADRFNTAGDISIRCTGYSIEHNPELEPALELKYPLLAQRSYWRKAPTFNKPLISNHPSKWHYGFHWLRNWVNQPVDPYLLLLHLHKIDYDMCVNKHKEQASRKWSEPDKKGNVGTHNLMSEGPAFKRWYFSGVTFKGEGGALVKYPEFVRKVI
jgi:hypothetical protein